MASPLASTASAPVQRDQFLEDYQRLYGAGREFNESEIIREGLTNEDLAERMAEARYASAAANYQQQTGASPTAEERRVAQQQLRTQYLGQINNRLQAQRQELQAARANPEDESVGLIGGVPRLAARGALEFASGLFEVGAAAAGIANQVNPIRAAVGRVYDFATGRSEAESAELDRQVEESIELGKKAIQGNIESARQMLRTPGAVRTDQRLAELRAQFDETDDDTFVERTGAYLGAIASGDGAAWASEQVVQGLALVAGAGAGVGLLRGGATAAARAASPVAGTVAAGRLAAAETAVGSALVFGARGAQDARKAFEAMGDDKYANPAYVAFVNSVETSENRSLSEEEADERFARHAARIAGVTTGLVSGVLAFIAPATEGALLRVAQAARGVAQAPTRGIVRTGLTEAAAEGAEEFAQSAIPSVAVGLDIDQGEAEQGAIIGALLGGATGGAVSALSPRAPAPLTDEQQAVADTRMPDISTAPPLTDRRVELDDALDIPTRDQFAFEREQELRRRSDLRTQLGFYPSPRLARLYQEAEPTPEQQAELDQLEREERVSAASLSGAFTVPAVTVAPGGTQTLSEREAAAFRDLREGRISFAQFIDAMGGAESARVLDLADRAMSRAEPIGDLAASFEATPVGGAVIPGEVSFEVAQSSLRAGNELAHIVKASTFSDVTGRDVAVGTKFDRSSNHPESAVHPVKELETYFSEPGGNAYAVNPSTGDIEFKPTESGSWRSISEADFQTAEEAIHAMSVAAYAPPGVPNDQTLLGIIEQQQGPLALEVAESDARARDFEAAQMELMQARTEAAAPGREALEATREARAAYVNSNQAQEVWANTLDPAQGLSLPPVSSDLTAQSGIEYARVLKRQVLQEAERLASVFERGTPAQRSGALRSFLARSGLTDANGNPLTATGSPQVNALVREVTQMRMTPKQRVDRIDEITSGRVPELEGAQGPVSLTDPDQFDRAAVDQFSRVARAIRSMSIREARFARAANRAARFADSDALAPDVDSAVIEQGLSPLADPASQERATEALAQAVVSTPDQLAQATQIPLPRDLAIQEEQARLLNDTRTTVEDIEKLVSEIDALPPGAYRAPELNSIRGAAANLVRVHKRAPSAPLLGLRSGMDASTAIQTTMNRVAAMTTGEVGDISASFTFTPTVGDGEIAVTPGEAIASMQGRLTASQEFSAYTVALRQRQHRAEEGDLNPAMSEDIIAEMKAVASGLPNPEIARIASEAMTDTPQQIREKTANAVREKGALDDDMRARISAVKRADFKLGARADNPMPRAEFDQIVEEYKKAFEPLGIVFRPFDSVEAYKNHEFNRLAVSNMEPEVIDAIAAEVRATPEFSARWQQAREGDFGGVVQLIHNTFENEQQLRQALSHELVAHYRLPDLLGPGYYERLRSIVLGATPKIDKVLYQAREKTVSRLVDGLRRGYTGPLTRAETEKHVRTRLMDLIANETLADMVELVEPTKLGALAGDVTKKTSKSRSGALGALRKVADIFAASRIYNRQEGTQWVAKLLQVSYNSLPTSGGNRMVQEELLNNLRAGLERLEPDNPSADLVRERGLQRLYRNTVNSEVNLQRIETAMTGLFPDNETLPGLWRNVRLANDRANSVSNARHVKNLAALQEVMSAVSTVRERMGGNAQEADATINAYLRARDSLQRHRYYVLTGMPSDNAGFEQRRAEIVGAARNALTSRVNEDGSYMTLAQRREVPAIRDMISRLEQAALDEGATNITDALQPNSLVWQGTVGETYADLDAMVNGAAGAQVRKAIADGASDPVSLDAALDHLREAIIQDQIESGSYGQSGANMLAASGMTDYVPQVGIPDEADLQQSRFLFRSNDPRYKALTDLEARTAYDQMQGFSDDTEFVARGAVRPRSSFNPKATGRKQAPTVGALAAFERRAYTAAYEVGTAGVNRALAQAARATTEEANAVDDTSNAKKIAQIDRDVDLSTAEGRENFQKKLGSGDYVAAWSVQGEPTLVKLNSPQLKEAVTDRFITQAQIESNGVLRAIGGTTRFYGRSLTSWNPAFVVARQFPRDFWEAAVVAGFERKLGVKGAASTAYETMANLKRLGPYYYASAAVKRDLLAQYRKADRGSWEREFARFVDAGGEQTFTQQFRDPVRNPGEGDTSGGTALFRGARGETRLEAAGRRVEGFTNLFDNAVRFSLYKAVKDQENNRDGVTQAEAVSEGVDVARSLMPFNRRSNVSRRLAPFYVFMNSAVASLSSAVERRMWNDGKAPTESFRLANGQVGTRLAQNWLSQVNKPMLGAMALKGFLATILATSVFGEDDEDGVPLKDKFQPANFTDGIVFPGGLFGAKRGEVELPGFFPEQLGVTGMAHAVGASVALLMSGFDGDEVALNLVNAVGKNMTPLNISASTDQSAVGSIVKGLLPTIGGVFAAWGFDENVFGQRITDFRDGQTPLSFIPTVGSNPGMIAAVRALDEATGIEVDPGQAEFLAQQFGVFGQAFLGALGGLGRYAANEPIDMQESFARASKTHVLTPKYGAVRSFYRYRQEYLDDVNAQFAELKRADRVAGDVAPDHNPSFTQKGISKMGPRAAAFARQMPPEFWQAKTVAGRLAREVGAIKRRADAARSQGRGDLLPELEREELNLYLNALGHMRAAFDDGYDYELAN